MQRFVSKAILGKGMGVSVTKKLKPAKKQSFLTVTSPLVMLEVSSTSGVKIFNAYKSVNNF